MKHLIKKAIKNSFGQMGDLVRDVTLKHQTGEVFDPSVGGGVATYDEYPVRVIISDYNMTEIAYSGGAITTGNKKVLLPVDELPVEPVSGKDKLVLDGSENMIERVQAKHGSLYVLRI
jgi:hypothetical protein